MFSWGLCTVPPSLVEKLALTCSTDSSQEQNSFPVLLAGLERDSWALMSSCVAGGRSVSPRLPRIPGGSSRVDWLAHVASRVLPAWV